MDLNTWILRTIDCIHNWGWLGYVMHVETSKMTYCGARKAVLRGVAVALTWERLDA